MFIHTLRRVTLVALVLLLLIACGGQKATLADIPAYPGAVALQEGESTIADTLANNNQMDSTIRGQIGVGGSTEQQGYDLPKDASWDQVKSFYDEKLKANGWGSNSMVSSIMEQASAGNDTFQTANWQKSSQNVTIVMLALPTDPDQKQLIVSLSTQ